MWKDYFGEKVMIVGIDIDEIIQGVKVMDLALKNTDITKVYNVIQFEYHVCNSNKNSKYRHISLIKQLYINYRFIDI